LKLLEFFPDCQAASAPAARTSPAPAPAAAAGAGAGLAASLLHLLEPLSFSYGIESRLLVILPLVGITYGLFS
jgi:hypothetical protein